MKSVDALEHPEGPPKADYEAELATLQLKMLRIQAAYRAQGRRAILAFEGSDAAGKGGTIRRLTTLLDPRGLHVHAIGAPTPQEQGRHYLYRFWRDLPVPGHITIFDRSWYGRVLVERVEGLCDEAAWTRAYDEINAFEQQLVDDGAALVKVLLCISKGEQLERFADRLQSPVKRWKFTRDDLRNRKRWNDYVLAMDDMVEKTHTRRAPWIVIGANNKRHARLTALRAITDHLSKGVDLTAPLAPHDLIRDASAALGLPLPPDVAPAADASPDASSKSDSKTRKPSKADKKRSDKTKADKTKADKTNAGKTKADKTKADKTKKKPKKK